MSKVLSSRVPSLTRMPPQTRAAAAPAEMPRVVAPIDEPSTTTTPMVVLYSSRARSARSLPCDLAWPKAFSVARPCTPSRKSALRAPYAARRARLSLRFQFFSIHGMKSVSRANARNIPPIWMSSAAMKMKISTGAMAATVNWRQVLPEEDLQTLDTFDHRHHYISSAALVEIAWPKRQRVVVEPAPKLDFRPSRGPIADGVPDVLEYNPNQDQRAHRDE